MLILTLRLQNNYLCRDNTNSQIMTRYLLFALILTAFAACKDDVIDYDYDPGRLHYDGVNDRAPNLPIGTNEAAAMFPSEVLDLYENAEISAVQLYIYEVPQNATLIFYSGGNGNSPGGVLIEKEITNQLSPNSWNTIDLDEAFPIPGSGSLWISLKVTDQEVKQVIGCDAGPSKSGGDWLYQSDDGEWRTFQSRSTDSINWNIRAVVL